MKFIRKNRNPTDCTVIAAYNGCSWCNVKKEYREVKKLAKSCGYSLRRGMWDFQFVNLMKKLNLPFSRTLNIKMANLKAQLKSGKCFLLLYKIENSNVGHAITVYMKDKKVKLINPEEGIPDWTEFATKVKDKKIKAIVAYELPTRKV